MKTAGFDKIVASCNMTENALLQGIVSHISGMEPHAAELACRWTACRHSRLPRLWTASGASGCMAWRLPAQHRSPLLGMQRALLMTHRLHHPGLFPRAFRVLLGYRPRSYRVAAPHTHFKLLNAGNVLAM